MIAKAQINYYFIKLGYFLKWILPSPNLLVDATNSPVSQAPAQAGAVPDQ
jgi:hypothetical protein